MSYKIKGGMRYEMILSVSHFFFLYCTTTTTTTSPTTSVLLLKQQLAVLLTNTRPADGLYCNSPRY